MTGTKKPLVATQLPAEQAAELEKRAAKLGISKSKYVALIIADWFANNRKLTLTEK